jgi:3-deoxy-D-manno-octulosonic-acid transferase
VEGNGGTENVFLGVGVSFMNQRSRDIPTSPGVVGEGGGGRHALIIGQRRAGVALGRVVVAVLGVLAVLVAPLVVVVMWAVPRLRVPCRDRLGWIPARQGDAVCVWFHAASAGDVLAVRAVLEALLAARPDVVCVCTVQTRSGFEMARRVLPQCVTVYGLAVDAWPWMDVFVRRLRPSVVVLEYLELWPRLLLCATRHGAAVLLQNARLSASRKGRYTQGMSGRFYRVLAAHLTGATALTESDADTLRALGVPVFEVCTHTKYADLRPPHAEAVAALALRRNLSKVCRERAWIAASAHRSDWPLILGALHALKSDIDTKYEPPTLLLCPRYPTDGPWFARHIQAEGFLLRREWPDRRDGPETAEVVLLETLGELRTLYAMACVAVMGGTFSRRRGGQNPLEAAAGGCLVVVGPHTASIDTVLERLPSSVLSRVANVSSLVSALRSAFQSSAAAATPAAPDARTVAAEIQREAAAAASLQALRICELLQTSRDPSPPS